MKKEDIFDLWEAQHKDEPKAPERIENEVRPEDLEEKKEETRQPEPEPTPEPIATPEPKTPEPKQEGGNDNGV